MKRLMITSVALLAWVSGEAMAAGCDGIYLTGPQMKTLLAGNTVCSPANCVKGNNCQWQEQHRGGPDGGELWDYKLGADPVDPTAKVGGTDATAGSSAGGASRIVDNYGPAGVYSWRIKQEMGGIPGSYIFRHGPGSPHTFTLDEGRDSGPLPLRPEGVFLSGQPWSDNEALCQAPPIALLR